MIPTKYFGQLLLQISTEGIENGTGTTRLVIYLLKAKYIKLIFSFFQT